MKISPPIFLIGMQIYCWKCQSKMSAVAVLAPKLDDLDEEFAILAEIVKLPNEILKYIQKRVPTFKYKYSKTINSKYYANTCPKCGVISGDFFLHSEPGAPFFPTSEEEASKLYMTEIPINKSVEIEASPHYGTGEMILNHAKKIA